MIPLSGSRYGKMGKELSDQFGLAIIRREKRAFDFALKHEASVTFYSTIYQKKSIFVSSWKV